MTTGYSTTFALSKNDWFLVEAAFGELFEAVIVKPERDGDPHSPEIITLIFPEDPHQEQLQQQLDFVFESSDLKAPKITIEKLPDINWLQHVYESLKPIDAGRFFVHGSHIKENIPKDKIAILIEAATAFGTGEHPTTNGCLQIYDMLLDHKAPKKILDMGCGSGILAIAAAKTLPDAEKIIGVDIDAQSIHVAAGHARDNHVEHQVVFIAGDGFRVPLVQEEKTYDLVFANILAQPLIEMSGDLAAVASCDIILSGFTSEQMPYVQRPYEALGFKKFQEINIDEWMAVWLTRK
jgi:ribosomal protein L11 methyltransferase